MRRNLQHRVEVAFPVEDEAIKKELLQIIDLQLKDNTKAVIIDRYGRNVRKVGLATNAEYRAQTDTYQYLKTIQ